ncbi:MAG: endonuclease V [Rhodocyclaceae bacterium]|nr:endonuclease V [Rhodocyclaceae bacterium]
MRRTSGDRAGPVLRSELIAQGWFASRQADPRLAARIGDYVLLMRENPGRCGTGWKARNAKQLGVHAGVMPTMHVLFILACWWRMRSGSATPAPSRPGKLRSSSRSWPEKLSCMTISVFDRPGGWRRCRFRGQWRHHAGCVVAALAYPAATGNRHPARTPTLPYVPAAVLPRSSWPCRGHETIDVPADSPLRRRIGIAHPRRLGIASHLGLLLDIPPSA